MRTTRALRHPATFVALGYLVVCLGIWGSWLANDRDYFSGDQPHYIIIAASLVEHGTLEMTAAYRYELATDRFGIGHLGIEHAVGSHAVLGPHGLYNVHNIGLPILLAPTLALSSYVQSLLMAAGIEYPWVSELPSLGCRLFMLLLSCGIPLLGWYTTGLFFEDRSLRLWLAVALSVAMPFTYSAQQVYPDIPAGIVGGLGLLFCIWRERLRPVSLWGRAAVALSIAYLPWLQIRFLAPAIILAAACSYIDACANAKEPGRASPKSLGWLVFPTALVCASFALACYNQYAFGKPTGPYRDGSLIINATALMVLLGSHLDQFHGVFLAQPLRLAAVTGVVVLFVSNRKIALIWGLTYAVFIVPTAMHPAWYGGFSMAGRFGSPGAVVLLLPAIVGLKVFWRRFPAATRLVIVASVVLQAFFIVRYTRGLIYLYNQHADTWLSAYSSVYAPLQPLLPALYDVRWSYLHLPNYGWTLLLLVVGVWGIVLARSSELSTARESFLHRALASLCLLIPLASAIAGWALPAPDLEAERIWLGHRLQGAKARKGDRPQPLSQYTRLRVSPLISLRSGKYIATVRYQSYAGPEQEVGDLVIRSVYTFKPFVKHPIWGTNAMMKSARFEFEVPDELSGSTFRISASTSSDKYVGIERLSLRFASQRPEDP